MGSNIQRLGDTLSTQMKRSSNAAIPTTVELGTINGDMSLTVDSLPTAIPQSDYMVDLRLTHDTYYSYNELNSSANAPHTHTGSESMHEQALGTGYHVHTSDGLHDHRAPSVFRKLKSGDRVLVVWVGFEPIIVAIVVAGTTTTSN